MALRISTNVESLSAQKNLRNTQLKLNRSLTRLSSGFRINKASDDAAGLAISETLKAKIRGLVQAKRNANDGISLIQIAEGGLNEVSNMMIRLRELAIQGASDTIGERERGFLDVEYQQLKTEIARIAENTNFNGTSLLNGSGDILEIQVGVNNNPLLDRIAFDPSEADATLGSLGITAETVVSKEASQLSLQTMDEALQRVSGIRAKFGAMQNRLNATIANLSSSHENLSAANTRIRDADIAEETAELTKNSILQQAGISVLGQANNAKKMALQLLG